jgi:hypothetical protein
VQQSRRLSVVWEGDDQHRRIGRHGRLYSVSIQHVMNVCMYVSGS